MTPNKEQAAKPSLMRKDNMLLYTDTIQGKQVLRDDMWAVSTEEIAAQIAEAEKAAEQNAVAWCIGAIDDLHTNHSDTLQMSLESDRCYKGIKNTIRDRYRSVTGIDPAPNYPIKATLTAERLSELQEDV